MATNQKRPGRPRSQRKRIEFVVADTKTYLFALTREPKARSRSQAGFYALNVYVINAGRIEIGDRVKKLQEVIAQRDDKLAEIARETYDLLFKAASDQLNGKSTWVIVPDDSLWQVPFVALQTSANRFLVEDHAVAVAPSLTALSHAAALRGSRAIQPTLLAAGNPAISLQTVEQAKLLSGRETLASSAESESEVKSLERLYSVARSKVYLGQAASEALIKRDAGKFNFIHLSAPALLSDASPLYSHVALSQSQENENDDGLLQARELMDLTLQAGLVVMSSSASARASYADGDGIYALAWSLFVAGCPASVVNRWTTGSPSTTELMLELHARLQTPQSRNSPSKAMHLQRAMISLLRGRYQHPFYWAGILLVGDFR